MSASILPRLLVAPDVPASQKYATTPQPDAYKRRRRRPDMQQGRALEALGHAIEYLVDSRMFLADAGSVRTDGDAVQILSRCSREVFAACEEVVPVHQRFKQWAVEHLRVGSLHS